MAPVNDDLQSILQLHPFPLTIRIQKTHGCLKLPNLMAEQKYTINEIAFSVGYNSISSFSNIFFRVLSIRPGEYITRTMAYKKDALS